MQIDNIHSIYSIIKNMKLIFGDALRQEIISLIKNAKKNIILVSPYIILNEWEDFISILKNKSKNNIFIEIHTKKSKKDIYNSIEKYFQSIMINNIYEHENLHAKLYLNENEAIITSLNLLDFSIKNNIEIGFKTDNESEYNDISENFVVPLLRENSKENIIKSKILFIDMTLNKKNRYCNVYFEKDNIVIRHNKYIIKIYVLDNKVYYKISFNNEEDYFEVYNLFKFSLSLYLPLDKHCFDLYNNENHEMLLLFNRDSEKEILNIDDLILDENNFYELNNSLYHIKATLSSIFYAKK